MCPFTIQPHLGKASSPRTIRFPESLSEELAKVATETNISFNMLVIQCCQYALEQMDKKS